MVISKQCYLQRTIEEEEACVVLVFLKNYLLPVCIAYVMAN